MKKLNAAIIGAGSIGALLDSPSSDCVLTHAHGYDISDEFILRCFVDNDSDKASRAAHLWGVKAYSSIEEMNKFEDIDVVSICTPTTSHLQDIEKIKKNKKILGGIIEKPISENLSLTKKIVNDSFLTKRTFLLNYFRVYLPEFKQLIDEVNTNTHGSFVTGNIYYGNGLLNNGSHMLNLLLKMGVNFTEANVNRITKLSDDFDVDATVSNQQNQSLSLHAVSPKYYKIAELELLFEKARIRVTEDSTVIEVSEIKPDHVYGSKYQRLYQTTIVETDCATSMKHVMANLADSINGRSQPNCSLTDGYEVQELCERLFFANQYDTK